VDTLFGEKGKEKRILEDHHNKQIFITYIIDSLIIFKNVENMLKIKDAEKTENAEQMSSEKSLTQYRPTPASTLGQNYFGKT
jgi:hypothetical protein